MDDLQRPTRSRAGTRLRRTAALVAACLALSGLSGAAPSSARVEAVPSPGGPGIGDPYFELDGNGGIDVVQYRIHDRYRFGQRRLSGWTGLTVHATQDLSQFNLDFLLPVTRVTVNGRAAANTVAWFRFTAKKGQRLFAECLAEMIDSRMDASPSIAACRKKSRASGPMLYAVLSAVRRVASDS